ncbi:BTAD domain-containing putative transcriptional regulator [Rubrivivax sp. RP6-9]|uniref:BTAD domain-containing putative transcriptional regulator n=1 Tax=Rubrivivax sp. RP6-9 TaxID=3415750 RepID=UPI003CC5CA5E
MIDAAAIVVGARVQVHVPARASDAASFDATGKTALLLALAALEGTAERRRAALLLWPDSPERQARNNLRTLVHRLNQRCGVELLLGTEHLSFDPARARVVTQDTEALLAALQTGGATACELLAQADVDGARSEALGAWLDAARQRWRRQQLAALSEALHAALAAGEAARAMTLARACVQLEPLSEHWHRQLMDTLARCGDRAAALAAYEDCKQRLRQHLGVLPDLQTRTVHLRLLQAQVQLQEQAQVPPQVQAQPLAAVNTGLTPLGGAARFALVEREAVLAEAQAAMARGQHVVLQGEAGVGKTRLLRHLAEVGVVEPVVLRPGARDEPYAAVAQLLQEVQPRRAPRIGMPEQVELARLAPLAFPEVQPSQSGLSAPRLHAALRHWAARLAEAGVQRLVLDDLHHADAASQAAFAALLAPHDDSAAPVLPLLLAHRAGEIEAPLAEALVAAQVHDQARCITLQRLSLHGVRALLRAMQAGNDDALAARLLQRTGGNPLFVIELARQLQDAPESDAANAATAATTDNLNALLRSRLQGCSSDAQQLASVAAVAGQDFSVELASAVIGQPPLALMDAWNELQQRGLFADHGTAHELVRDAALAMLPQAIGRTLHGQVAGALEALGLVGTRVLRHWIATGNFERALPHAVHHLRATGTAGLPTAQLELDLLDLLERVSDDVLLDNVWLTAEAGQALSTLEAGIWSRLDALVARVSPLARSPDAWAWVAYTRAGALMFRDRLARQAYELLSVAVHGLDEHGPVRAQCELFLAQLAFTAFGRPGEHARRARHAAQTLATQPDYRGLLVRLEGVAAWNDPTQAVRDFASRMRDARRRGAKAQASDARRQIAEVFRAIGQNGTSLRHLEQHVRTLQDLRGLSDPRYRPSIVCMTALGAGRYGLAQQFLDADGHWFGRLRFVGLATLRMRLGQWSLARALLADHGEVAACGVFGDLYAVAALCAELDLHDGKDPSPAYRLALDSMQTRGFSGINLQLMAWEVSNLTRTAAERLDEGMRLVEALSAEPAQLARLPVALLQVAETHAQAGSPGGRALALRAAQALRRGRVSPWICIPDGLVRCATLLQASDPQEAAALVHVARRWVLQALQHVPAPARESYCAVPVNRLLLDGPA